MDRPSRNKSNGGGSGSSGGGGKQSGKSSTSRDRGDSGGSRTSSSSSSSFQGQVETPPPIMSQFKFTNAGSFCSCSKHGDLNILVCKCGENPNAEFSWKYSSVRKTPSVVLEDSGKEIKFHPTYSSGTAAVMGDTLLTAGKHYYWELRMITPVYGTDVMIGVATEKANIDSHVNSFSSLLGKDRESWGYSYHGNIRHDGKGEKYYNGRIWGQGAILGVHLDMWRGTLEFYVNRKPLGIAFRGIPLTGVYPIVSSTAAKSGMRLICAQTHESSLAFFSIRALLTSLPSGPRGGELFNQLFMPPGLKTFVENNFWYLVQFRRSSSSQTQNNSSSSTSNSVVEPSTSTSSSEKEEPSPSESPKLPKRNLSAFNLVNKKLKR